MLFLAVTKKFNHVTVKFHSMIQNQTNTETLPSGYTYWKQSAENRKNYM